MSYALRSADSGGLQRMEKLIEFAPDVAEVVLDNGISESSHATYNPDYHVTYDFQYLQAKPENDNNSYYAPRKMIEYNQEKLLLHPLTRMFIKFKWRYIGRLPYLFNLFTYMIFLTLLTWFTIMSRKNFTNTQQNPPSLNATHGAITSRSLNKALPSIVVLFCVINLTKEVVQLGLQRMKYWENFINLLELSLFVSTIMFMVPFLMSLDSKGGISDDFQWSAGAVSILLAWINVLLYMQRYAGLGIYVIMFVEILKTVLKVLSLFAVLIIGFALSFNVLMAHQETFTTPHFSWMKVLVMSIGEMDYENILTEARSGKSSQGHDLLPYDAVSYLVFAAFLVIMPIIMMNLLIGLALGDIDSVKNSANVRMMKNQVDLLHDIESWYPLCILKLMYREKYIYYPNALSWYQRLRRRLGFSDPTFENLKKSFLPNSEEDELKEQIKKNTNMLKMLLEENKGKLKKKIKENTNTLKQQGELLKKIAEKLGISDEQEE